MKPGGNYANLLTLTAKSPKFIALLVIHKNAASSYPHQSFIENFFN